MANFYHPWKKENNIWYCYRTDGTMRGRVYKDTIELVNNDIYWCVEIETLYATVFRLYTKIFSNAIKCAEEYLIANDDAVFLHGTNDAEKYMLIE